MKITKQLVTMEDLAQGIEKVSQNRGGNDLILTKLDVTYPVSSVDELKELDFTRFTLARVFTGKSRYREYYYDEDSVEGIRPNEGTGSWIERMGYAVSDGGIGVGDLDGIIGRDALTPDLLEDIDFIAINKALLEQQQLLIEALDTDLINAINSFGLTTTSIQDSINESVNDIDTLRQETEAGFIDVAQRISVIEVGGDTQIATDVTLLLNTVNDPVTGLEATRTLVLNEYVTESALDSAIATSTEAIEARIFDGTDLNTAFIGAVDTALVNSNGSIATSLNNINATIATEVAATIDNNYYTIAQTDSAIASSQTAIEAVLNDPTTGLQATRSLIENNYYTSSEADTAIAAGVDTLETQIFTTGGELASAFVTKIESATSGADGSALATRVEALEVTVDDPSTGLDAVRADLITTQQALVNESTARASEISTLETNLGDNISAVSTIATSARSQANRNEDDIEDIEDSITSINTSIATISTQAQTADNNASSALSLASSVETRVGDTEDSITAINSSIANLSTTANNADSAASSALSLASTAENLAQDAYDVADGLVAYAFLEASTTSGGRTRISGIRATANSSETNIDFQSDTVRFLNDSGDPVFYFGTSTGSMTFENTLRGDEINVEDVNTRTISAGDLGANFFVYESDNRPVRINGTASSTTQNGYGLQVDYTSTNTGRTASGVYSVCDGTGGADTRGVEARGDTGGFDFYASGSGSNYGPFTGSHEGLVDSSTTCVVGDIVCDSSLVNTKNISNSIFVNVVSSTVNNPTAVGVVNSQRQLSHVDGEEIGVAALENLSDAEKSSIANTYDRISFNSVGEGSINVCSENGDITAGDLITTSSTLGKGMKQSDDLVRNYTVAKARQSYTFASGETEATIACIYMCG